MKKFLFYFGCVFMTFFGIFPSMVVGQNCGTLATGHIDRINGRDYCHVDNTMRGCTVIIDPCPVE